MNSIKKNKKGFTLIETLLYISLIMIVLFALISLYITILTAQTKSSSVIEVEQQGAYIMDVIQDELRMVLSINQPTWRAAILEWKALIPNVQVHCYINYQEFFDSNSARVWQQMLRDEIVNLYPEYQLNDMNGNGISVWPGMTMNNLLSSSPVASNGLTFHQWYVKKLVEKMQLPDHDEVCDGFHLDNQNYITSWIPEWLGPVDADFTDYWDFDVKWQDGLEMIIDGLRAAFPDKEISCRSKSHRFLEKCDRVIFEQTLTGPPNTDIPGGWLGRIHQARIIQKYTSHMVLHYDYSAWWLESDWQDKLDQYVETTMSACMTNDFECAFDLSGPDAHDFIYQPHMGVQCGAPISDRVDAFATVHSVPGQTFVSNNSTLGALPVQRGDVAVFWRDIFGGDFNHSIMTGIPNEQRWNAGLFAAIYNGTSLNLGLTGGGELMIEDLLVVRPTDPASTGYDYRNFEGCETFVNMTTTFNPSTYAMEGVTLQAETRDGRTLIIEPGRACIVTYVEGDVQTTCAITE